MRTRLSTLSAAVTAALTGLTAGAAMAQDSLSALEEVVVTGTRKVGLSPT